MKFRNRKVRGLYQDNYTLMSHQESLGHNHNIKIPDSKKPELYSERIKCTLHLKDACNNQFHNLLPFYWPFKNTKAKLHRTVILLILYICQICPQYKGYNTDQANSRNTFSLRREEGTGHWWKLNMEEEQQHVLPTKFYLDNEMNKCDICKARGMHGRHMHTGFWLENLMARGHLHRDPILKS